MKNLNTFEYFTIFFLSHFNEIEQNVCLNFHVWLWIVFSSQIVIREEKKSFHELYFEIIDYLREFFVNTFNLKQL